MRFIIPLDEMRLHFEGRIICENERCKNCDNERCKNSDWSRFTYMFPRDGKVLVQCKCCNRTFFRLIEPNQYDTN